VITPTTGKWQWKEVHDDLYAKAVVLKSGETTIAIVSLDLGSLGKEVADVAKAQAQELTGIPAENILIAATHTHYAPFVGRASEGVAKDYADSLTDRIADALWLANGRLAPAMLGHGSGSVPDEVFNRRYWMKDGPVVFNPLEVSYQDEAGEMVYAWKKSDIVRPAGPTDPEVGVLAVLGEDWKPIAVLANYALHYVGGPHYDTMSADYFGYFERALQRMAGADFAASMLNGTCGDINNVDYMASKSAEQDRLDYELSTFYQIERVSNVVAAEVFRVWQGLRRSCYAREVPLGVANDWFRFQYRKVSPEEVTRAKEEVLATPEPHAPNHLKWLERIRASAVLDCAEHGPERVTQIQAFRLGDIGLVGLPGEIFVEIGMAIKKNSPFKHTLVGELANDNIGYLPTDKAMDEPPSYEVLTSRAAVGTAPAMVQSAVGLLAQLVN